MPTNIIVATGTDPKLAIDYAAFRAVDAQTGLGFTRLHHATWTDFMAHLQRLRMAGSPAVFVHLSMHMSPDGTQFADRLVSPDVLSGVLRGVQVLFLAGCRSTAIGDLLGVVPYVVTMLEDVTHEDARAFSQLFWIGIGNGLDVQGSYDIALERLPSVSEFAYLHTHMDFLAGVR